jgi:hypothetical protein
MFAMGLAFSTRPSGAISIAAEAEARVTCMRKAAARDTTDLPPNCFCDSGDTWQEARGRFADANSIAQNSYERLDRPKLHGTRW